MYLHEAHHALSDSVKASLALGQIVPLMANGLNPIDLEQFPVPCEGNAGLGQRQVNAHDRCVGHGVITASWPSHSKSPTSI